MLRMLGPVFAYRTRVATAGAAARMHLHARACAGLGLWARGLPAGGAIYMIQSRYIIHSRRRNIDPVGSNYRCTYTAHLTHTTHSVPDRTRVDVCMIFLSISLALPGV